MTSFIKIFVEDIPLFRATPAVPRLELIVALDVRATWLLENSNVHAKRSRREGRLRPYAKNPQKHLQAV